MNAATSPPYRLAMDPAALTAFLENAFPPGARPNIGRLVTLDPGHARMVLEPDANMTRPGGIVSGPTQMGLVDVAAYAVILAHIGPVAMAVTNSLSISFLRGCRMIPLMADARLLKLGRRLATVDVRLWQEDEDRPVAQATVSYALP